MKIAPESLLHQARIQQFWKRGPRLLFAIFYPIYTQILLNCRTPPWSASVHEIGDEYHFFLKCTVNHSLRNNLFNKIILNKPDFYWRNTIKKKKILLNASSELLAEVGDFIKQSTELQKWGPWRSKVWHVKNIMIVNRIYFVYPIIS